MKKLKKKKEKEKERKEKRKRKMRFYLHQMKNWLDFSFTENLLFTASS